MKSFLKNQENHKDVVQLTLCVEESKHLYWENENEFRYKGEMYDVIEKKAGNSTVIIRCISDKKETRLLNDYQKHNKQHSHNSAVVQLITAQFVLPGDHSLKPPETLIKKRFKDYTSYVENIASSVLLPPPDVC